MNPLRTFTLATVSATMLLTSCNGNSSSETATAITATAPQEEPVSAVIELADPAQMPDNGRLVVIDFNASWCGPCRRFAPTFHAVAREFEGKADFVSVDVDKFPDLANRFGVTSIPHVTFLMPDGSYDTVVGTDRLADFATLVKEHLGN